MPIADCRLPIADCRLPIADCRLPIADCRFYGNGVCGQVILVGLCHVFSSCIMPMTSATDKSHYTHKNPNVKIIRHSRPGVAGTGMTGKSAGAGMTGSAGAGMTNFYFRGRGVFRILC